VLIRNKVQKRTRNVIEIDFIRFLVKWFASSYAIASNDLLMGLSTILEMVMAVRDLFIYFLRSYL